MREMGVGRDFKPRMSRGMLFGLAIALDLIAAVVFGVFLGARPTLRAAIGTGAAVGLAWVTPSMLIAYLFAGRSLMLAAIDAGYVVVQFLLFGAIFFWLG